MELRSGTAQRQMYLPGMDPVREELHARWEDAKEKEKKSRSKFAQLSIKVEEVRAELLAVREAIGAGPTVQRFVREVLHLAGVPVVSQPQEVIEVPIDNHTSRSLQHAMGRDKSFFGRFDLPVKNKVEYLSRTHPIVEGLASWVMDTALDDVQATGERTVARRCGATQTKAVTKPTTLLLVRLRYHLNVKNKGEADRQPLLAEEVRILAYTGSPDAPIWLDDEAARPLLDAAPSGTLPPSLVRQQLTDVLEHQVALRKALNEIANQRASVLENAHQRVRHSVKVKGKVTAEPVLPVDFLGCFILIPDSL